MLVTINILKFVPWWSRQHNPVTNITAAQSMVKCSWQNFGLVTILRYWSHEIEDIGDKTIVSVPNTLSWSTTLSCHQYASLKSMYPCQRILAIQFLFNLIFWVTCQYVEEFFKNSRRLPKCRGITKWAWRPICRGIMAKMSRKSILPICRGILANMSRKNLSTYWKCRFLVKISTEPTRCIKTI